MGAQVSTLRMYECQEGWGMCASAKHGLVIVSCSATKQLHCYSLADGSLVRSIGSKGRGKGEFSFSEGGLCICPDGDSVLLAEDSNMRVQQVRIVGEPAFRIIGERVVSHPQFVDCNDTVIVAVETALNHVVVLSWATGEKLSEFGRSPVTSQQLRHPCGVRLLNGVRPAVVVADKVNRRLCVYSLSGDFKAIVGGYGKGWGFPHDVLVQDLGFIVSDFITQRSLKKVSKDGAETYKTDCGFVTVMAAVSDETAAILSGHGDRFYVVRDRGQQLAWLGACCFARC